MGHEWPERPDDLADAKRWVDLVSTTTIALMFCESHTALTDDPLADLAASVSKPVRSALTPAFVRVFTSCVRLRRSSFWKTWVRWVLTVARLTNSESATSWLDRPSATRATTFSSAGVNESHPATGRLRAPRRRRA